MMLYIWHLIPCENTNVCFEEEKLSMMRELYVLNTKKYNASNIIDKGIRGTNKCLALSTAALACRDVTLLS